MNEVSPTLTIKYRVWIIPFLHRTSKFRRQILGLETDCPNKVSRLFPQTFQTDSDTVPSDTDSPHPYQFIL
jgi:hypothetical protein